MGRAEGFGLAMRIARKARGMTQEDFSDVSSRTYVSTLERGAKSPTLEKIIQLADAMQIHPLALLALAWAGRSSEEEIKALLENVALEASTLASAGRSAKN